MAAITMGKKQDGFLLRLLKRIALLRDRPSA